ncbi:hypothetical protein L1049_002862 [Liquidambar formosana]|uniref:CRM domain-containing protein n=1 Tax=Liquidambar formosana TaxID=63359 RepID=A0AAP0R8H5_LIQFO
MPTAPWMKGPLLLQPNEVLDISKPSTKKSSSNGGHKKSDCALTDKVSGRRGKKAMQKIVESIEKLQLTHNSEDTHERIKEFEFEPPLGEVIGDGNSKIGSRMPWVREERIVFRGMKKEKVATAAELSLDGMLLGRLRGKAARMRRWVKVMKAGVTQAVVDQIKSVWRKNELAMVKFGVPLCRNMDRAREIVEIKTGGFVVWSKKDTLVVYRGYNYQFTSNTCPQMHPGSAGCRETPSSKLNQLKLNDYITIPELKSSESTLDGEISIKDGEEEPLPIGIFENVGLQPINGSLYEREADRLLDGLGPRYIDWWMPKPLPVDADLLPEVVPGFKCPFRLCPPSDRPKLTDDELTYLRKLARPLPTHFVLGRNRKLQGLAAAILKLWEKSLIVKIAVKWGIPNTSNEQMAYELKCLTRGDLVLRNKFFIILYRGKDFLPCRVANLIAERDMELKRCQLHEENARLKAIESIHATHEALESTSTVGTLSEFQGIVTESGDLKDGNREAEVRLESEKERLENELRTQERKLYILKMKIKRSEKELSKVNSVWKPAEQDADQEMMTEEERECFRKMGLKMDSKLVLGRRGVFDGVIEGLYQHWKHREIAKVITMQRAFSQVIWTAKELQAESGGVLVSIDKLKEGHAIIIYRGKNYRRPLMLVTKNLLTKRKALQRSLEMQRIGSLKFFAYQRQQTISDLKVKLAELQKEIKVDMKGLKSMS